MLINCTAKSKVVNFTYIYFTTIFKNSKAFIWSRPNVNSTLIFPCVPVDNCRERKIYCGDCVMNRGTTLWKEQDPAWFLLGILVFKVKEWPFWGAKELIICILINILCVVSSLVFFLQWPDIQICLSWRVKQNIFKTELDLKLYFAIALSKQNFRKFYMAFVNDPDQQCNDNIIRFAYFLTWALNRNTEILSHRYYHTEIHTC